MSWLDNTVLECHHKLLRTDGEIGVEIEMEGKALLVDLPNWGVTYDSSLKGKNDNLEYVLRKPLKVDQAKENVVELYQKIGEREGSEIDNSMRAGVHIHVNVQHMSLRQLFTFLTVYWSLEEWLIRWCGPDRVGNLFCLRLSDAEYGNKLISAAINDQNIALLANRERFKYLAANLETISKYGSLEFRSMQTSQQPERINQWIDMLVAVRDLSLTFNSPIDYLGFLSGGAAIEELLTSIHPELLTVAQDLGGLEEQLYLSIRDIQFWIYTTDWN